jgi:putative polyhydroxyalkanoate system protein
MAKVNVTEAHSLEIDEAKRRVAVFEDMLGKFGVKLKWSGYSASFKGLGVSGSLDVTASNANVQIKLGMMAKAAGVDAKKLEGSVSRRLREAFDAD